jgi:hypothetical protein
MRKQKRNSFLLQVKILFLLFAVTATAGAQTVYNFRNCGATGVAGPSQAQVNSTYTATTLAGTVTVVGAGIQQWTVPVTGTYSLAAAGASGGFTPSAAGGKGRAITVQMNLTAGTVMQVLVGQEGGRAQFSTPGYSGGGGGGTFIINKTTKYTFTDRRWRRRCRPGRWIFHFCSARC